MKYICLATRASTALSKFNHLGNGKKCYEAVCSRYGSRQPLVEKYQNLDISMVIDAG